MTLIKAVIAVTAFAAGPFISFGLMGTGTPLGGMCGLASAGVWAITFVAFVGMVMEKIK